MSFDKYRTGAVSAGGTHKGKKKVLERENSERKKDMKKEMCETNIKETQERVGTMKGKMVVMQQVGRNVCAATSLFAFHRVNDDDDDDGDGDGRGNLEPDSLFLSNIFPLRCRRRHIWRHRFRRCTLKRELPN